MEKTNVNSNSKEFIKLKLDVSYENYQDFVDNNKELMYRNMFKIYEELTKTNEDHLKMVVESEHGDKNWSTNFVFSKTQTDQLISVLLPYFEEKEEYELCAEILKIHKKLNL